MAADLASDSSKEALALWASIPEEVRPMLLADVSCIHCGGEVVLSGAKGMVDGSDLVLIGRCSECGGDIARVIESE
jgi:hypothetical protein